MTHYPKLSGQLCYLSPCQMEDVEKWEAWFNDLEVSLPLGDEAYIPMSDEKMAEELRAALLHHAHIFSIIHKRTGELIGRCVLFQVDMVNQTAMLGMVIGEKGYWGKGYGREALRLLLDYGFNLLNLNNIMVGVFSFNHRAVRSYRALGFQEIGRRREARLVAGKRYDVILLDLLAEEFRAANAGWGVATLLPNAGTARDAERESK